MHIEKTGKAITGFSRFSLAFLTTVQLGTHRPAMHFFNRT